MRPERRPVDICTLSHALPGLAEQGPELHVRGLPACLAGLGHEKEPERRRRCPRLVSRRVSHAWWERAGPWFQRLRNASFHVKTKSKSFVSSTRLHGSHVTISIQESSGDACSRDGCPSHPLAPPTKGLAPGPGS